MAALQRDDPRAANPIRNHRTHVSVAFDDLTVGRLDRSPIAILLLLVLQPAGAIGWVDGDVDQLHAIV
jgi:hypothetical protein